MPSHLESVSEGRADLLVIGGGIHGLFAAYDAALRGLSVVLIDRADFGSGLTFNHQRTLHGGLRALQRARLGKVREQIRERRAWARIAPHLIRPLPFLVGTYGWTMKSRWAVRSAFKVYDAIGRHRNRGVPAELHLPRARLESAAATRRLFQGISETGLSGGAIWYDYQTIHPDRLSWVVALAARQAGARLVNYVEAVGLLPGSGRVEGARVRDTITGEEGEIRAAVTLLAVGAAAAAAGRPLAIDGAPPVVRAMNALLNRPARDIATAAPARSGRMLTAVPWRGYQLVGTYQSDAPVDPAETHPPAEAVDHFLDEMNHAFSRLKATRSDIRLVHHGLTPAGVKGARADLLAEPVITDHARTGRPGLVSLIGVKFTGARLAAERAVNVVAHQLGGGRSPCRTAVAVLPHADIADVEGRLVETLRGLGVELDRDVLEHLGSWYGTEASEVVRYAAESGQFDRVAADIPVLAAEIGYAVDRGQARRLADAVLRRTPLGSAGHPGRAALEAAAAVMAARTGWAPEERAREIQEVERQYPSWSSGPLRP